MKKFLKSISIITVIFLICLVIKLNILDFSAFRVDEEKLLYDYGYYFNQLQQDEKEIYVKIDDAAKNIKKTIFLGTVDVEGLSDKISKVLTAYFYDNPDIYYVSNQYMVSTSDLRLFTLSTLELNYIIDSAEEIKTKSNQLDSAIDKFINSVITDDMTEFEKELAIHDELVKQVNYYNYESIDTIPTIKHTAYGALVQNEAVCDGYSKAFKLLLDKVGIDNIIISGSTEQAAHAWNIVNIGDEYYHVDATSDKLSDTEKHVIHTYFNLNDKEIANTHIIDNNYNIPKCNATKYEYYNQMGYYISQQDNLYNKLNKIINIQNKSGILEIKADEKHTTRRIIDTLYELDFNNWHSNRKSSVEYTKVQEKYIFVK